MAQNFFGTLTAPQLPLLDANFSELYGFKNLFTIAGANVGLGVAVSADWDSGGKAFQLGPSSALYNPGSQSGTLLTSNLVYRVGSTTAQRLFAAPGAAYLQSSGAHRFFAASSGTAGETVALTEQLQIEAAGTVRPGSDGGQNFGAASFRWAQLFASTGTINTSDAREKTAVRALTTAEVNAAKALAAEVGAFKFLSAIAAKGEPAARLHVGMTVQRAIEVMTAHGLNPMAYGFICYDEWDADEEQGLSAGNRYSLRPDELLAFVAAGFHARLAALEATAP
jgi:hypothetical protein